MISFQQYCSEAKHDIFAMIREVGFSVALVAISNARNSTVFLCDHDIYSQWHDGRHNVMIDINGEYYTYVVTDGGWLYTVDMDGNPKDRSVFCIKSIYDKICKNEKKSV
jgi:hypothetical protein